MMNILSQGWTIALQPCGMWTVNVYGEQEGRTNNEEISNKWSRLMKEVDLIKNRKEMCLLIGDMNKHIGSDELGVRGNEDK